MSNLKVKLKLLMKVYCNIFNRNIDFMNDQLNSPEGIITLENYEEKVAQFKDENPSLISVISNCSVEDNLDEVFLFV